MVGASPPAPPRSRAIADHRQQPAAERPPTSSRCCPRRATRSRAATCRRHPRAAGRLDRRARLCPGARRRPRRAHVAADAVPAALPLPGDPAAQLEDGPRGIIARSPAASCPASVPRLHDLLLARREAVAHEAVEKSRAARDAISGSAVQAATVIYQLGRFGLALALVIISLNAMRTGLLTRFFGVLGILSGLLLVRRSTSPASSGPSSSSRSGSFLGRWIGGRPPPGRPGPRSRGGRSRRCASGARRSRAGRIPTRRRPTTQRPARRRARERTTTPRPGSRKRRRKAASSARRGAAG